jgi:peroxiredoxin
VSSTRRPWAGVGAVIGLMVAGAWALLVYGAVPPRIGVGSPASAFSSVDVRTRSLIEFASAYRGAVTLVNIWTTTCAPCRQEMPAMERVYRDLRTRGFRIAAVSVDRRPQADVLAFATELGLTFDVLHDPSGAIERDYQTIAVPESFLIDRQGRIARKVIGAAPWDSPANRRVIEALLDGR